MAESLPLGMKARGLGVVCEGLEHGAKRRNPLEYGRGGGNGNLDRSSRLRFFFEFSEPWPLIWPKTKIVAYDRKIKCLLQEGRLGMEREVHGLDRYSSFVSNVSHRGSDVPTLRHQLVGSLHDSAPGGTRAFATEIRAPALRYLRHRPIDIHVMEFILVAPLV